MGKFQTDLSKGNVVKQLIMFALPFLISNLIQSLYSVSDMIIVGRYAGVISMSGVNIGSQVTLLITNAVVGLSVGGTVLIAQYLGAGNKKAMKETIGTLFSVLMILSLLLTILMLVVRNGLLSLIKTPEESFSEASSYFFITAMGTVFIFGYNALSAVMRGMGDSKNPLIFVSIACVVNIILDFLLVAVFSMGARGAALATVVSQAISMILCVVYLKKSNFIFDFSLKSFALKKNNLLTLLKIGGPTSINNIAVGTSFLFLTSVVNSIGLTASAALGAVAKFNGFAILPAVAMSSSISAMAAQNIGAGKIDRAKKTMFTGMILGCAISYTIFALVRVFPQSILKIFVDMSDPNAAEMIDMGVEYIGSFSFDYLLVPITFCLNGLFIGAGHTSFSLINGLLSSLFIRIPVAYILGVTMGLGMVGVGFCGPVASFVGMIICIIYFLSKRWQKTTVKLKGEALVE